MRHALLKGKLRSLLVSLTIYQKEHGKPPNFYSVKILSRDNYKIGT